jgi:hypothetical protein
MSFEFTPALKAFKLSFQCTRSFKVSKSDTILSLQNLSGTVILINIDERQKFGSFCVSSRTALNCIDFGRIFFSFTTSCFLGPELDCWYWGWFFCQEFS